MSKFYNIFIYLILCVLVFVSCKKEEQNEEQQSQEFIKFYGGNGLDKATDLITYKGGFAITGTMQTSDSAKQACLIVTDGSGNELSWSPVLFGGIKNDIGNKILSLQNGDLLIIGTKEITPTATDSCDILVARISDGGTIRWIKTFGGNSKDEGLFGLETALGEVFVGGYTESFGNGGKDICLYKINIEGGLVWSNPSTIGFAGDDIGSDIHEFNNSLFVAGETKSFNALNRNDIFIAKVAKDNGLVQDYSNMPNEGVDFSSIKFCTSENSTNNTFLLNGQATNVISGLKNIFVSQISTSNIRDIKWAKHLPSDNSEIPGEILLSDNNINVVGTKFKDGLSMPIFYNLNLNGDIVSSRTIVNSGKFVVTSAINTSGNINCFVGYSLFSNYSQIVLTKGLVR